MPGANFIYPSLNEKQQLHKFLGASRYCQELISNTQYANPHISPLAFPYNNNLAHVYKHKEL